MKRRELIAKIAPLFIPESMKNYYETWKNSPEISNFLDEEEDGGNPLMPEMDGDTLILHLYSMVWDYGFGAVGTANFVEALRGHTGPIKLFINSMGGEVTAGMTIRNMLVRHPGKVTGIVDGIAASISSAILTGCDERLIYSGGMLMLHRAESIAFGNRGVMAKKIETLDKVDTTLAETYAEAGNGTKTHYASLMEDETWLTAQETAKEGLATLRNAKDDPKRGVDNSASNALNRPNPSPSANGGAMTPEEQVQFDAMKARAETAETKAQAAETAATQAKEAADKATAALEAANKNAPAAQSFTSIVDGVTYTTEEGEKLFNLAKREHDAAVQAKVNAYPAGLQAAAKTLIEANDENGLKQLESAKNMADASTKQRGITIKAGSTQGAQADGDLTASSFDEAVKARMQATGATKAMAELQVASMNPELLTAEAA